MDMAIAGIIRGHTIELARNPGIPDGERVEVVVRSVPKSSKLDLAIASSQSTLPRPPGWYPGCHETAAGMLSEVWSDEDDRILDEIERARARPVVRDLDE